MRVRSVKRKLTPISMSPIARARVGIESGTSPEGYIYAPSIRVKNWIWQAAFLLSPYHSTERADIAMLTSSQSHSVPVSGAYTTRTSLQLIKLVGSWWHGFYVLTVWQFQSASKVRYLPAAVEYTPRHRMAIYDSWRVYGSSIQSSKSTRMKVTSVITTIICRELMRKTSLLLAAKSREEGILPSQA